MSAMQAIYPLGLVQPEQPLLSDTPSPEREAEQEASGSHAGVHSEAVRPAIRVGGTGTPFAFCKGSQYVYRRFPGDITDARVDARAWGMINGYMFDGELSEHGLEVALTV